LVILDTVGPYYARVIPSSRIRLKSLLLEELEPMVSSRRNWSNKIQVYGFRYRGTSLIRNARLPETYIGP